jgi:FtsP/CotA-like multicopper oxidase with cupredoxin domain
MGGASGAIVVEGIEVLIPSTRGLPEQVFVIRDHELENHGHNTSDGDKYTAFGPVPAADLSINHVMVPFPTYPAALLQVPLGLRQLWRVVNAAALTILDLELVYDGVPQLLEVVALDGVPMRSKQPSTVHIYLPNGGRAEFIITTPLSSSVKAELRTRYVDTGPGGDSDPARPLLRLLPCSGLDHSLDSSRDCERGTNRSTGCECGATDFIIPTMPSYAVKKGKSAPSSFPKKPDKARTRYFYFSQTQAETEGGEEETVFFITERGKEPVAFSSDAPPAVVVERGYVEDWVIENDSPEVHVFHIHQLHFIVVGRDGAVLPESEWSYRDSIAVGTKPSSIAKGQHTRTTTAANSTFMTISKAPSVARGGTTSKGTGNLGSSGVLPYSVTLRMDFSGDIEGVFVYHCHILEHEDRGMMAYIQVVPPCTLHKCVHQRTSMDLLRRIFGIDALWGGESDDSGYSPWVALLFKPITVFCVVMLVVGAYQCWSSYLLPSLRRLLCSEYPVNESMHENHHHREGCLSKDYDDVVGDGSASALLDLEMSTK